MSNDDKIFDMIDDPSGMSDEDLEKYIHDLEFRANIIDTYHARAIAEKKIRRKRESGKFGVSVKMTGPVKSRGNH